MDLDPQRHRSGQAPTSSTFVQVCDRCRWKKIKCNGAPCSNCRAANFPCETRARLSKQATPRSYVQYLESRVKHLESLKENGWSPNVSSSKHSPYGETQLKKIGSPASSNAQKHPHGLPDWTTLGELGTHIIDQDGFSRYMGPSSGVGFTARVLHEVLDEDDQPTDREFYSLFNLDDFTRSQMLAEADTLLWQVTPTNLPERPETDRVIDLFFLFTERVFPVLHQPTFRGVVDHLYQLDPIHTDAFELLAQFYFVLSIGYCFDMKQPKEERTRDQIHALQTACRCHIITLHARRDGLTRLQTLALHSYALNMLRQRSEGLRISAMANIAALDVGLHHDGQQFNGNPLETVMRRRVFWCTFNLHLFNSSLQGLPRALHEADITIAEPNDIDDEQLTCDKVLNSMPGRTKIHRFVSACRLARILSRVLDVLYTHNRRKAASSKIVQMNRLCCEHLLDQLDFSYEEVPDDLPEPDAETPEELAILASYANEQMLYHYVRWLVHRPGLVFPRSEPQFTACLQSSTDAASALVRTSDKYKRVIALVNSVHPLTIFVASLTPAFRTALARPKSSPVNAMDFSAEEDYQACLQGISALTYAGRDNADKLRLAQLQHVVSKAFGKEPCQPRRLESDSSRMTQTSSGMTSQTSDQSSGSDRQHELPGHHDMVYNEQRLEHMTAHEDLRNLVHEAFSPTADPWAGWEAFGNNTPKGY